MKSIRIFTVLIMVASLTFAVRFSEILIQMDKNDQHIAINPGEAQAFLGLNKDDEKASEEKEDADQEHVDMDATEKGLSPLKKAPKDRWPDASETDFTSTRLRMELFDDLGQKQQELEKQEQDIDQKLALLRAAQSELDKKYEELESIRTEIEDLLVKKDDQESAQIQSLVKIYEGMKAKDAAAIFNTMDMTLLVDIISRMSERKSAPVLAAMNPDRARTVTMFLIEEKKLPSMGGG